MVKNSWMVIGATAALWSCTTASSRMEATETNTYQGTEHVHELVIDTDNENLAEAIDVLNPRSERRDGKLTVQFELKNKTDETQRVQWAVDWFDDGGFQLAPKEKQWRTLIIPKRGTETVSAPAPDFEAVTWKIFLQETMGMEN